MELDSEVSDARQLVVSVFHNLFGLPEWSVVSFGVIDSDWSIKNETKERDNTGRSNRVRTLRHATYLKNSVVPVGQRPNLGRSKKRETSWERNRRFETIVSVESIHVEGRTQLWGSDRVPQWTRKLLPILT